MTRRRTSALAVLALAATLVALRPAGDPDWQRVRSRTCGFSLEMPGDVDAVADTVQTAAGPLVRVGYYAINGFDVYNAGCTVFPEPLDAAARLDAVAARLAARGEVVTDSVVAAEPPTRHVVASLAGGDDYLVSRTAVVGRRLVEQTVSTRARTDETGTRQRFFASFRWQR